MIRTPLCDLLRIELPIALGGMGGGHTSPAMVSAVANAGGIGALGFLNYSPEQVSETFNKVRGLTNQPFAANFIISLINEDAFERALSEKPEIFAFAWARQDQDLKPYFDKAHDVGAKVTFMAASVPEALRGVEAGADVIIAQGSEGGGHVGWMATLTLVPMVVDALKDIGDVPVMAAGGIADGRGLAAAIALGAQGALMGTRFLATEESPLHPNFKQAILDSDGHDTVLTEIIDLTTAQVWPGAMSRAQRNRFIERWTGREWEIRARQSEIFEGVGAAREAGNIDNTPLSFGQDAGLIHDIPNSADLLQRMAEEASLILKV